MYLTVLIVLSLLLILAVAQRLSEARHLEARVLVRSNEGRYPRRK